MLNILKTFVANCLCNMHFWTFVWVIKCLCCFIFVARTMEIIFNNRNSFSIIFTVVRGWGSLRPCAWSPTCYRKCAYCISLPVGGIDLSLYFKIKHPTLPIWTQCSSLHTLKNLINLVLHFEEIKEILCAFIYLSCDSGWREKKGFEKSAGGT